jgi:hypothetical protein
LPSCLFASELFFSSRCETVEPGALFILGGSPFGLDPTRAAQAVKRRVKATVLDLQEILGFSPNDLTDTVPMLRAPLESAQD